MEKSEIIKKMNRVFVNVLEDEGIVINENSNMNNVEDWDSLNHVFLLVSLEEEFGIKFDTSNVENLKNVKSLLDEICRLV